MKPVNLNSEKRMLMRRMIAPVGAILLVGCTSQSSGGTGSADNRLSTDARPKTGAVISPPVDDRNAAPKKGVSPSVRSNANRSAEASEPAAPSSKMRGCYLKVDGIVRVDGPCLVFPLGKDEYTLNTWTNGKPKNSHFAQVVANPDGTGTATWNADPDDDRALNPLGTVRKDGDCWVNDRARICVR